MKKIHLYIFGLLLIVFLGGCEWKFWEKPKQDQIPEPIVPIVEKKDSKIFEGQLKKSGLQYFLAVKENDEEKSYELSGDNLDLLDPYLQDEKIRIYGYLENDYLNMENFYIFKSGIFIKLNNKLELFDPAQNIKYPIKGEKESEISANIGLCGDIWGSWQFAQNSDFLANDFKVNCSSGQKLQQYLNTEYKFSFQYPYDWKITEQKEEKIKNDENNKTLNITFSKNEEKVVLVVQKEIPRIALSPDKIIKLEILGVKEANLYLDSDSSKVIFDLPNFEYDFYLAGKGSAFDLMYNTIEMTTEEKPPVTGATGECENDFDCVASGCSGQICQPKNQPPINTTCEYKEEYACYQPAECQCNSNKCGWSADVLKCVLQKQNLVSTDGKENGKCGTEANISCEGSLICRFDSGEKNAAGICVAPEILAPITQEELEQGWYLGFSDQRKPETPKNWVWVGAGKNSKWQSP